MLGDLFTAITSSERVKWFAEQAKTLATQGEMTLAAKSVSSAETEIEKVIRAETQFVLAKKKTRNKLLKIQLGNQWPPPPPPRS
jgi:hypothetical protein